LFVLVFSQFACADAANPRGLFFNFFVYLSEFVFFLTIHLDLCLFLLFIIKIPDIGSAQIVCPAGEAIFAFPCKRQICAVLRMRRVSITSLKQARFGKRR
jgi:hypothetical protein